ncbi:MAG: 4-hydroxyphenylpyruvate dioxygenase [Burkholderiaceae bacterium]|nr:4-hydroxyphenylpyruvate dioxygenase [Burkholderiaceae bacterium]
MTHPATKPTTHTSTDREAIQEVSNPLGMEGVEFIEYTTAKPQQLGQVLETMGFRPIARHRSREILLYRQGSLNVIVNAHGQSTPNGLPSAGALTDKPVIAAIALRVRDAAAAYKRALDRGAWAIPANVAVMELNIPAIHGVGTSRIYFVDRYKEFSIYDVDFTPIPTVDQHPPAIAGLHFFGIVQYIGNDRTEDWTEFYRELFGFTELASDQRFGILPKGRILRSPCTAPHHFYLQLIEPEMGVLDVKDDECLQRMGLGTPDVAATVAQLRLAGVEFVGSKEAGAEHKGALTRTQMGNVTFELVHDDRVAV